MNKRMIWMAVFLLSLVTYGQNEQPQDELGAWYILASNSKVSEKINVQLQTQFRYYEVLDDLQQFKIRTGVTYAILPSFKLGLGYGYFRNDPSFASDIPENFDEHRIVLDGHLSQKLGKVGINHRYRFEQRYLEDLDHTAWMRYMLKLSYPLSEKLGVDVYDEVFLNISGDQTFAQNWIGVGLSYKINNLISTRMGYQSIQTPGADFNRLLVSLTFKPDFSTTE